MAKKKIYKIGLMFSFDPQGEHEEIFEDLMEKTEEQMVAYFKSLASEDIDNLVKYNEVYSSLQVEIEEVEESENS